MAPNASIFSVYSHSKEWTIDPREPVLPTLWKLLWPRPKPINPKSQQICPAAEDALWNLAASFPEHPDMQLICFPFHSQSHFCSANICPTKEWCMESWEVNLALLHSTTAIYWWFKCFPPGSGWLSTLSRGKKHWFKRSNGKQFLPIHKIHLHSWPYQIWPILTGKRYVPRLNKSLLTKIY